MKPKITPIFSDNFLSHYLSSFNVSAITDVRNTVSLLESLIKELDSGKIGSLKEEEFKSRFVSSIFGVVLGFHFSYFSEWYLREEKKSLVDGKKPDATLGFFYIDKTKDDVRAVIEIKDANTDLDTKQDRKSNLTPVEQAFSYVSKMGGNCQWVIVSNIKEIRFYRSRDESKCQIFYLNELLAEGKRNELLFLFHKNHFIKKAGKSRTEILLEQSQVISPEKDVGIHIIDKLYNLTSDALTFKKNHINN